MWPAKHKNPCTGDHEIHNFVDPFLVIITIYLFCLNHALEQRGRFLKKKNINFTIFTPKVPPLWVGGHEIYNFLSSYPTGVTY